MNTLRAHRNRALPGVDWLVGRRRQSTSGSLWPIGCGLALAALAGYLAGGGNWQLALAVVGAPAFIAIATAAPERTALGLLVVLPFLTYPVSTGGYSLFLGVPLFGFTGLMLMTRQRGSLQTLRGWLPVTAFAVLISTAVITAAVSTDLVYSFSRVFYLALFAGFAWALATALSAGRLSREAVARAIVIGGALGAAALLIQFAAQFGTGKEGVIEWLRGVQGLFAGERTAAISTINWKISSFDLLRGIFPFMTPPVAGQYLMLTLIAGIWLRREHRARTGAGSALELGLLILIGAGLLATLSRQAWLGAAVGLIALGIRQRPAWMFAVIFQIFLIVSIVPIPGGHGSFGEYLLTSANTSSASGSQRLDIWNQAIDLIPEHAVLGVGPGLIGTLNPDPQNPVYYAHNAFLDSTIELGIVGGLAFLALFWLAIKSAVARRATLAFAMLTAYVVANLFDDTLYTPRSGLLLAVAFALIAGREQLPEKGSSREASIRAARSRAPKDSSVRDRTGTSPAHPAPARF